MIQVILLFGLGLLLIVAEVLIPSMGIIGLGAALCILGALGWAFQMDADLGMRLLLAAAVLVPAALMLALKLLPRSPFTKKLMARGFSFDDGRAVDRRDTGLEGAVGVVEATLRPAGTARIDDRRVDVISRGEMIEAGTRVKVVELRGNRVVVERHPEDQ
ncbi:MAG: membrane-bound serine protease (ClpP class) [Chlamydiales bacterium]